MFFKNLKWQLLASSILAVILIACLIALAANSLIIPAIILAVIIGAYIVVVNVWFDHYISKPIQDLTDSAKRIANGSYGTQVPTSGDNEIGELTSEINQMSEKIAQSDKTTCPLFSAGAKRSNTIPPSRAILCAVLKLSQRKRSA